MSFERTADLNWHHKEITLLNLKWVKKTIVVHVEMRQFGDQDHQGQPPGIALSRISKGKQEDVLIVKGRVNAEVLVSLDHEDRLIGRINKNNPNSAGNVSWRIVC